MTSSVRSLRADGKRDATRILHRRHQLSLFAALVFCQAALVTGWSPSDFDFFDDLRFQPPNEVKARTTGSSPVVEVTAHVGNASTAKTYRLCHLTSIIPISNGIGEINFQNGVSPNAAALMAVTHFNQKNDSVVPELAEDAKLRNCNVRLTIQFEDSQFSPSKASAALIERALPKHHGLATPKPCGIMGEVRSAVSAPLSVIAGVHHLPIVSYRSTSTVFNNKDIHEFFSRTVTDDSMTALAAATYLRNVYNVTHCGILFIRDDFGSEFHTHFLHAAHALDPPMRVVSASYDWPCDRGFCGRARDSLSSAMGRLLASEFNFFIGVLGTNSRAGLTAIADAGYDMKLFGTEKYWLLAQPPTATRQPGFYLDSAAEISAALGMNGWNWLSLDIPQNDGFSSAYRDMVTDDAFREIYLSKQRRAIDIDDDFNFVGVPYQREYFAYDAIMAIGIAACQARPKFFGGHDHLASLRNTSFHGASGHVQFNRTTGTRLYPELPFKVINFVANAADSDGRVTFRKRVVGHGVPMHKTNQFNWKVVGSAVYGDNTTDPPLVLPLVARDHVQISRGLLVAGLFLTAVVVSVPVVLLAWTAHYRCHRVVQMSQPGFLVMLCVGSFCMASCLIPRSFQTQLNSDAACMAVPWLYSIGYVVAVSALFSKVIRLHKIQEHSRNFRRITVGYVDVLKPFMILFAVTITLLTAWTIVDPWGWNQVFLLNVDRFGRYTESYFQCSSSKGAGGKTVFFPLILGIQLCALLVAAYHLYKARSIVNDFDEGPSIVMSIASVYQTTLLTVPTLLIDTKDPSAEYVVYTALVALVTFSVLLPIFVPKIEAVRSEKTTRDRESLQKGLKVERNRRAELVQTNLNLKSEFDRVVDASATATSMHLKRLRKKRRELRQSKTTFKYALPRVLRSKASTIESVQIGAFEDSNAELGGRGNTLRPRLDDNGIMLRQTIASTVNVPHERLPQSRVVSFKE